MEFLRADEGPPPAGPLKPGDNARLIHRSWVAELTTAGFKPVDAVRLDGLPVTILAVGVTLPSMGSGAPGVTNKDLANDILAASVGGRLFTGDDSTFKRSG